jgi:hypothetical protein
LPSTERYPHAAMPSVASVAMYTFSAAAS